MNPAHRFAAIISDAVGLVTLILGTIHVLITVSMRRVDSSFTALW